MLKDLFQNRLFIGALAFFSLCVVGGTLYISHVEKQDVEELATDEDRVKQGTEKQQPQPTAKAPVGDTSQGGHWHGDEWHEEPHAPVAQLSTDARDTPASIVSPPPTGPLTYHAELLASHPVEALRQQGKERGHWSADHIPPFPPDDQEAAEFARYVYLIIYYQSTGQTDHPEYIQAFKAEVNFFDALQRSYDAGFGENFWDYARNLDLRKITWPLFEPFYLIPLHTTFTEADGINPQSARPLLPFELEASFR